MVTTLLLLDSSFAMEGFDEMPLYGEVVFDAYGTAQVKKRVPNDGGRSAMNQLRDRCTQLEERCTKLEQMVLAMWDAPGMPGATAILEEFEALKKINRSTVD